MFVIPSTLQLLLAIVLVLLGVSGNLVVPFVSYRTALRCPHIVVLAALDSVASLLGPGLKLVTTVKGPNWLEHNQSLCRSLNFLSSSVPFSCLLVVFFLALFCQKVHHNGHSDGRRRVRRREFVFLAVCLLAGLFCGVLPLMGWHPYQGLPFLHSCLFIKPVQSISYYSLFYFASSFVVLTVTMLLALRAVKHRPVYALQLLWERHELEMKINDPELTTTASSGSTSFSARVRNRSVLSHHSARSSISSYKRPDALSIASSPVLSRTSSQQFRGLDNSLLEIILRNVQQPSSQHPSHSGNGSEKDAREGMAGLNTEDSFSPATSGPKDSQRSSHSSSYSGIQLDIPRDPFVISSRIPYKLPALLNRKNHFQSARALPQLSNFEQQRSLSRLLLLRCCVTGVCWLPYYTIVVLQLSAVDYPQELHVFFQWLFFIQSSIASLLPLCDANYRQALRHAVYSILKACKFGNKAYVDLYKTQDVEFKIEETQQVRLTDVRSIVVARFD